MTSRGKPGSGVASGARQAKQKAMPASKKTKQSTGAKPVGYGARKVAKKTNAPQAKAKKAVRGSSDREAGKTTYSYR